MNIKLGRILKYLIVLVLLFLLGACGGTEKEITDPKELIVLSSEKMRSLGGFQYKIDRTGEPAFIDDSETISFRTAEGNYVVPDKVTAKVKVITPLIVTEVDIISIGDQQWETNVLTGLWQKVPVEYALQPQELLNPNTGLQALLEEDLYDLTLVGLVELEEMPGKSLQLIQGLLSGQGAYDLTYGMIDNEVLSVQLWIDPDTYDIHRVVVVDPMNEGDEEDTVWQIDFWDFDTVIEINPPIEE